MNAAKSVKTLLGQSLYIVFADRMRTAAEGRLVHCAAAARGGGGCRENENYRGLFSKCLG